MYGMLVKQALMAMGVTDPTVFSMVDRVTAGGFENPNLEAFSGSSIDVPEGAETLLISATKQGRPYKLILICEKTS